MASPVCPLEVLPARRPRCSSKLLRNMFPSAGAAPCGDGQRVGQKDRALTQAHPDTFRANHLACCSVCKSKGRALQDVPHSSGPKCMF